MRVHPKYHTRHRILTVLFNKLKYNDAHFFDLNDSATSVEDLARSLKTSVENILTAHHGLTKHIKCDCTTGNHIISINSAGIDAFIDNYWLREGQKDLNERIFDKSKWIVPVLALVVTIGSLIYTAVRTSSALERVNKQQTKIDSLNNSIELLLKQNQKSDNVVPEKDVKQKSKDTITKPIHLKK